jgi:hypothetical protein
VDVKPANIELTFYLLRAMEVEGDTQYPKVLEPTMEHESGIPFSKLGEDKNGYVNAHYRIRIGTLSVSQDDGQDIFSFNVEMSINLEKPIVTEGKQDPKSGFISRSAIRYVNVGASMESAIDIREGQSVVLGKSNFDNTTDALFVILQARAVD